MCRCSDCVLQGLLNQGRMMIQASTNLTMQDIKILTFHQQPKGDKKHLPVLNTSMCR